MRLLVLKALSSVTGGTCPAQERSSAVGEAEAFGIISLANSLATDSIWHKLAALARGSPRSRFAAARDSNSKSNQEDRPDENSGADAVQYFAVRRLALSGRDSAESRRPHAHTSPGHAGFWTRQSPSPCFHSQSTGAAVLRPGTALYLLF